MANGLPLLISGLTNEKVESLKPIGFKSSDEHTFSEDTLQKIIHGAPSCIPAKEFYPSIKSLCSLGREIPVKFGERQGRIDNLFIGNDGHLVLVETKLFRNPESMREVIAQIFEYGMTLSRMSLDEFESQLCKPSEQNRVLQNSQSILDFVRSKASEEKLTNLSDEFEEKFNYYRRVGEMLFLIVSDGIQVSVERLVKWLNRYGGSTPFSFGLIEIPFYMLPDGQKIAVPRTLARTKELGRHVVVIDVKGEQSHLAHVECMDETKTDEGKIKSPSRVISSAGNPMTKEAVLNKITTSINQETSKIANILFSELDEYGYEYRGTMRTISYGLIDEENDDFIPLFTTENKGIWFSIPRRVYSLIKPEIFIAFKNNINQVGEFFAAAKVNNPDKLDSKVVLYQTIYANKSVFFDLLENLKNDIIKAIIAEQ